MRARAHLVWTVFLALGLIGYSGACKKGPAERTGEKIDDAFQGDKGPAQRTGERLDRAAQSTEDAARDLRDAVRD